MYDLYALHSLYTDNTYIYVYPYKRIYTLRTALIMIHMKLIQRIHMNLMSMPIPLPSASHFPVEDCLFALSALSSEIGNSLHFTAEQLICHHRQERRLRTRAECLSVDDNHNSVFHVLTI